MSRTSHRWQIDQLRAQTVCAKCGAQPIEWHNPEHAAEPNRRIARMTRAPYFSVQKVLAEIAVCTPLCRKCHRREDGMTHLYNQGGALKSTPQPPKPCAWCERPRKPLRRGLCKACYEKRARWAKGATPRKGTLRVPDFAQVSH